MARVRGKDTVPERLVRSALHRMGYRFRLHRKDLPGTPDVVIPGRKLAIFVHGCFWHSHPLCHKGRLPKSKLEYWEPKLKQNSKRDRKNLSSLRRLGWKVVIIWQCETQDMAHVEERLRDILDR
jgi:DNA mismatch endonuclease (patch repair protein)